jgi:hypothetical protein
MRHHDSLGILEGLEMLVRIYSLTLAIWRLTASTILVVTPVVAQP